jgi:hypothetical protein
LPIPVPPKLNGNSPRVAPPTAVGGQLKAAVETGDFVPLRPSHRTKIHGALSSKPGKN